MFISPSLPQDKNAQHQGSKLLAMFVLTKTKTMNKLVFFLFGAMIVAASCGTPKSTVTEEETPEKELEQVHDFNKNLHDIWVVTSINGEQLPKGTALPRLEVFPEEGRIAGNAGCNEIFGGCHVNGANITFARIGTTKKYCPDAMELENLFITTLQEVDSYQIKSLQMLFTKAGKPIMTLKKVD